MTRDQLIASIKQQLRTGKHPTPDEVAELLVIIDEVTAECWRERRRAQQACVDRDAYNSLFDEHVALVTAHNDIVQELEAQRQHDRKLVMQAQLDQNAYRILIAAHNMLSAAHNQLLAALERVGLRITKRKCGEGFAWGYRWDSEDWIGSYPTPAETVEAALRARLCAANRKNTEKQPNFAHFVYREVPERLGN